MLADGGARQDRAVAHSRPVPNLANLQDSQIGRVRRVEADRGIVKATIPARMADWPFVARVGSLDRPDAIVTGAPKTIVDDRGANSTVRLIVRPSALECASRAASDRRDQRGLREPDGRTRLR